jgi:hypothetical protein
MIPMTYEPLEGVLFFLKYFSQWIGIYGGMIRLDIYGVEIPTDGCCDPTREKGNPEACTRKKEGCCTKDTLENLDLGGFLPFHLDVDP